MMLSRKRRQYDFYVCYDEEEKASLPLVKDLTATIEDKWFVGQYQRRECLPGSDIGLYHRTSCGESDIVICLIGKVHLEPETSVHIDNIVAAMAIKKKQGMDENIIPIFCDVDKEHVYTMMHHKSPLFPLLKLSEFVCMKDEDWKTRTLAVFDRLPSGNN